MKTRRKTAWRAAAMLVLLIQLAGCGNEADPELSADTPVPVQIAEAGISAQVQTRATTISSGSMGVFRLATNNYPALYNIQYNYASGWSSAKPILVGVENASLCAYYPYGAAAFNANSTTCTLAAQKYDAGKDLCYATTGGAAICNKTPNVSFAMKRGYARIALKITRGANYVGNCNITNVNLKNGTNFFISRTLDIINNNDGGSATGGGWTYALNTGNMGVNETNTAYDMLVPPQPLNNGLTITLTIDGKNRAVILSGSGSGNNFTAGRQYTVSLTITDTKVVINGGINITDMTDGGNLQNDTPQVVG